MATPKNNSVLRAFAILQAFDERSSELTASDVAKRVGLNLATAHRFLLTLEHVGAVARTPRGRFQLGMTLADLGARIAVHKVLADGATPFIEALAAEVHETAHVVILDGHEIVEIVQASPRRSLRLDGRVGRRLPAYCTAFGKMLLSGHDDAALDAYFENVVLERLTPTTIADETALRAEIANIRKLGYAIGNEEAEEGLYAISIPIVAPDGRMRAAISVSGPVSRMSGGEARDAALKALRRAASGIQHQLYHGDEALEPVADA